MAKSDKNRERDRELDTEIDMEEMDDLTLEDPWGGESSTDDTGGRKPANPSRRILTEGVKGMAEGAMETVGTELERNMPNLGVVASEVKGTYEDILEVKDEISKQLQPLTLSMEKTARKILPRAEKLLPKSWYQKIKTTLDRREDERRAASGAPSRSVESERADLISSELAAVFQQQLEMNQHNELEEKKRELMDRAVSSTQHRDDQHAYARIYDSVRSIELSHRTHMLAYMKKSLELKYKHLFIAQDTFNLLSRTASVYEGYLQGIVKNTSLPDVMKTNMSDYIRKSRTDKYGTMMADFMSNARKIFFDRVKSSIKNLGSNLQFAMSGIDQTMEGIDMANEMGEMTGDSNAGTAMAARMGGGLLGSLLAAGPTRRLLQKFAPWTRTINGKLGNVKTRAYMGLDKKRAEWSQSGNFFKELIADFLPSINTGVTGSNDLLTKGEDAAAFDKITRQSIVEIIPGYLGKIWHEIAMLRTGRDDIEEQGFNLHRRRFTTVSQIQEDIFNDERMFGGKGIQTQAVSRALATVRRGIKHKSPDENAENVLKGKEDVLSKIIANHVQWREHFDPDTLSQFAAAPNSERFARNSYIQKISKGINLRDFVVVTRAIARGLTDKDGKLNTDLCRNFDNAILDAWQQADSYLKTTPYFTEAMGMRRFMADVDEVSVLEDVLDENGKVVGQAKKIIQKGRRGLIGDSNKINRDLVGERMSRFESGDVAAYEQGYDRDLQGYLSDLDYVRTRLHEMKDDLKKSRTYKSAVDFWTAASAPFKTPGVPTPGAPGAAGATPKDVVPGAEGSPDFMGPMPFDKLPKSQQVEFLLRRGDYRGAAAAGLKGAAGSVVDFAKKAGTAVNNVSGVAAAKVGASGTLRSWAKDTWNWVDKKLDSLPQSPEEVEACIDNLGDQCASLWKKTPKDRKAALKRLRQLEKKLRKRFPKQAAFIDAKIKQMEEYEKAIEDSRVGKFVKATGKYAKKKADPYVEKVSKATGHALDAVKEKAHEVESKIVANISESTGVPAETLSKALRGDKEALEAVKKAAPEVWDKIKQEQLSKEALEKRKESIVQGAKDLKDTINESIKEGVKQAGAAYAASKATAAEYGAAFREGAGIKDKVEGPKVEGVEADIPDTTITPDKPRDLVNDELMKLLTEWRDATTTEHTKISDLVTAIGQQLADGINVNGIGGGGGGGEGTIKRKRYGLFGRAGDAISRGAKGLGGALWSGAKKVGGLYTTIYGSLWRGASNVAGSVYRGAANAARFVTSEIGVTPYLDLYVKGQEGSAPILTWRKQAYGKGVVFVNDDGSLGDRVKTTKEIIKSKKQVADPETGNILVSYEDHEKGLWCRASGLSTISRMGMLGIRAYGSIYSSAIKAVGGIGKVVAEGIFGKGGGEAPKFVDVYLKGHIKDGPLVTRRQQVKGFVVFKDGSKVERSSDIHEPVYDITTDPPSILVTEEQIKEGLCDVNGNPLGTGTPGREGLLGKMFNLGGTIAKGIFGKTGLKIVGGALSGLGAMYKGIFDAILGGGSAIGRGVANIGARLFGFDNPNGFGRKAFTGLNTRLDALIRVAEAIRDIAGEIRDNGGTGGGGGSGDGGSGGGSGGLSPKGGPGGGRRRRRTRRTARRTAAPAESEDTISEEVSSIASEDPFDTTPEELARAKKRKAALKKAASRAGKWVADTKLGKWVAGTKVAQGIGRGYRKAAGYVKSLYEDDEEGEESGSTSKKGKKTGGRKRTPSAGTARSGGSSKYTAEARKGKAAAIAGRGKSAKEEHVETSWATEEELAAENGDSDGMSLLDYYFYYSMLPAKWRNKLKWKFRNIKNFGKAIRKGSWNAMKQGWKGFRSGKGIMGKIRGAGSGMKKGYLKSYRSTRNAFKRTMPKSMKKPGKLTKLVKGAWGRGVAAAKGAAAAVGRAGTAAKTAFKTARAATSTAQAVKTSARVARTAKSARTVTRATRVARGAKAGTRMAKASRMMRGGRGIGRILRPVGAAIAAGAGALFAKNAVQAASTAAPGAAQAAGQLFHPDAMKAINKGAAEGAKGAAKSGSWWTRIFGGGEKAAGEAATKGAEKVAAKGAAKAGEKAAAKAAEKAAAGVAEGANAGAEAAGKKALPKGSAAAILDFMIAGADANEARKDENVRSTFGKSWKDEVTEHEKDVAGGQAAQNAMSSGMLFGLDHLILGDSINNKIGEWAFGDRNAKEKASKEIDQLWGADKVSVATNLRGKLGDHGGWDYINPIVGLANVTDGITNTADRLGKDIIGSVVGLGTLAYQNSKNRSDAYDSIQKFLDEHPELAKTKEGQAAMKSQFFGDAEDMGKAQEALFQKWIANKTADINAKLKAYMSKFAPEMEGVVYDRKSTDGKLVIGSNQLQRLVNWCMRASPEFKSAYLAHNKKFRATKVKDRGKFPAWYEDKEMASLFSTWYTANIDKTFHVDKSDPNYTWVKEGPNPSKKPSVEKAKDAAKEAAEKKPETNTGTGAAAAAKTVAEKVTSGKGGGSEFKGSGYGKGALDWDAISKKAVDKFGGPVTVSSLGLPKFKEKFADFVEASPEYNKLSLVKQSDADDQVGSIADKIYADCKKSAEPTKEKVKAALEGKQPLDATSEPGKKDETAKAAQAAASAVPEPVKDKASGKPPVDVPAAFKGGRRRTMTRAQVAAINKRNKEVMESAPPELKKLIPELFDTLTPENITEIVETNKLKKVSKDKLARSVKSLNEHTIFDMPLIWYQNTKEKSLPPVELVRRDIAQYLGKGRTDDKHAAAMWCASYLVFGFTSWSPELSKMYVRRYKYAADGSPAGQLWSAFHNKQPLSEGAAADEAAQPKAYKEAKAKWEAALADREAKEEEIDSKRSAAWKQVKGDYDAKWREFCKSKNYDPDNDDFDIGSLDTFRKLRKEFTEKHGKEPDYREWLKAHPEFDVQKFRKEHDIGERPDLDAYEEAEAAKKKDEKSSSTGKAPSTKPAAPSKTEPAASTPKKPSTPAEKLGGQSPVASKIGTGEQLSHNEAVNDYVQSIGGVKAVRKMKMWDFVNAVKKHAANDKKVEPHNRRVHVSAAEMHAKVAYAKAFGITGQFSARMGELIDPKTGKPVVLDTDAPTQTETGEVTGQALDAQKRDAASKKPDGVMLHMTEPAASTPKKPDETLLTPPQKPKEFVSPVDLRSSAQAAQNNRVDRVVGALKPAAQVGPTIAAAQEMNSNQLQAVVDSNNELSSLLRSALGGDGLRVAGMETLIGVTASGIGGGGGQQPQIINNNYSAPEDTGEGIDLRKKQL